MARKSLTTPRIVESDLQRLPNVFIERFGEPPVPGVYDLGVTAKDGRNEVAHYAGSARGPNPFGLECHVHLPMITDTPS